MKCRIRKTNEIVDVVGYSACTHTRYPNADYVCYIDSEGNEIVGRGLNLIWDFEPINEESVNDWQSFRAEAAKDILSNSLIPHALKEFSEESINIDYWTDRAIEWADCLIAKLKEKKEK